MAESKCDNTADISFTKNIIIISLLVIVILSILGISLSGIFGNIFSVIISFILNIIYKILAFFGITLGYVVNTTTDVVTDTSKFGIDIAGGAVHDIGNLILKASGDKNQNFTPSPAMANVNSQNLYNAINNPSKSSFINMINEDTTFNPIQKPISAYKHNTCLPGEYGCGPN